MKYKTLSISFKTFHKRNSWLNAESPSPGRNARDVVVSWMFIDYDIKPESR